MIAQDILKTETCSLESFPRMKKCLHNGQGLCLLMCLTFLNIIFPALLFWPGFIDNDGLGMFRQIEWRWADDYFPLALTYIWHLLLQVLPFHFGSIFAIQLLMVALVTCLLVHTFTQNRMLTALLTVLTTASPCVTGYGCVLVKDVWFGTACALAVYCLSKADKRYFLPGLLGFALCAGLAFNYRANAFFALLPLCLFFLPYQLARNFSLKNSVFFVMASCLLGAGLVFSPELIRHQMEKTFTVENRYAQQVIFLYDLSALSIRTQEMLIPEQNNPFAYDVEELAPLFSAASCAHLFNWSGHGERGLQFSTTQEEVAELQTLWLQQISNHPRAYLRFRFEVFLHFFQLEGNANWFYHHYRVQENPWGFSYVSTPWREAYLGLLEQIEGTILNRLYCYALLLVTALAVAAVTRQHGRLVCLLSISSLSYLLGTSLITPHTGFRYGWYAVFCSIILLHAYLLPMAARCIWMHGRKRWQRMRQKERHPLETAPV